VRLLDHFSISVPVGARVLLVSRPEGSASMLLRILAGLSPSNRKRVELAGIADPKRVGWSRRVAYIGPGSGLYGWMSPREALELSAHLHELTSDEAEASIAAAIDRFRLSQVLDEPMVRGGEPLLERVGLAAAMLSDPEVVLLDEPLRAIEPEERRRLLRLPGKRRTVVLASRYPASEVGLCNQVVLIRDGRLALSAQISLLEELGLPLSTRGIEALADRDAVPVSAVAAVM
jgi:ABC-2 type transport system ATP-binding protein